MSVGLKLFIVNNAESFADGVTFKLPVPISVLVIALFKSVIEAIFLK